MGVRLQGEYKSTGQAGDYNLFTVQIIDTAAGDIQSPVVFTRGGVTFNLNGQEQNPHTRFTSQTIQFSIVEDNDPVTDFIAAMSTHDEERFFVKVGINGTVKYIGILTGDGHEWEDLDRTASPLYKLLGSDGMGRLDGKNYAEMDDTPYTGYATIAEVIYRCMEKVGTKAHFAGQPFFAILHDNVEDSQVVSGDPLGNQRVDQGIFYEVALDTGTYNFKSCREVLEYICVAYNLCLRYVGPYYLFYNPKLMEAGASAYAYNTSGSYTGSLSVGNTVTINDDKELDANRKGISPFGVLPPLHRARITYDHGDQDVNMLFGVFYSGYNHYPDPGPDGTMIDLGPVTVHPAESVILRFSGKLRTRSDYYGGIDPPRWKNHRYQFKIKLKITWGAHEMWWWRDHGAFDFYSTSFSNYTNPDWYQDSGQEEYDWVSDIIDERQANINLYHHIGFDTRLLVSGQINHVYFGFEVVEVFDEKLDRVELSDNPVKCWWEFSDLELIALEDGVVLKRPTKTVSEALGNELNSAYLEETTIIGDGPGKTSLGRIQVYDGSDWRDSALWGGKKLHLKSVQEIAEARASALRKLLGGFYAMSAWMDTVMSYNGILYYALSCQYVTGEDDWSGEWIEIGSAGTGITTKEKRVLRKEKVDLPLNPNRLPDDEELQWRITIPQTKEAHTPTGGPYTSLEMRSAAEHNLWRNGDVLNITDPVIGWVDELTLTADVRTGDTIIYFESWTPSKDFPPGSYLEKDRDAEAEDAGENVTVYRYHEGWTGSSINVIDDMDGDDVTGMEGILLPDEGHIDMTRAIYAKRVEVYISGQKLMYFLNVNTPTQYDRGFYGVQATDTIHFYEPMTGQPVEIYIKKIYKED